jgi:hypothetical protein
MSLFSWVLIAGCCAVAYWLWSRAGERSPLTSQGKPSVAEALKIIGLESYHDAEFGVFAGHGETWALNVECDFPFRADVKTEFTCEADGGSFPQHFPAAIRFSSARFAECWNSLAAELNELIERQGVALPERFAVKLVAFDFGATGPEVGGDWRIGLRLDGLKGALIARFRKSDLIEAWYRASCDEGLLWLSLRQPAPRQLPAQGGLVAAEAVAKGRLIVRVFDVAGWVPLDRELYGADLLSVSVILHRDNGKNWKRPAITARLQGALQRLESCLPAIEAELGKIAAMNSKDPQAYRQTLHTPALNFCTAKMAEGEHWAFIVKDADLSRRFDFEGDRLLRVSSGH